MFPEVQFQDTVTVTGGCLKRGQPVTVHRVDGIMYVLMEKSEWVSHASVGASRSRTAIRRTWCIDRLRERAIERAQLAVVPSSALADDPMRELEQHVESADQPEPPTKRRRVPLVGLPPTYVHVLVQLVAPVACGYPPEGVAFDTYVLPRSTTRLAIYVLSSQVPTIIAYVRYELMEMTREHGSP